MVLVVVFKYKNELSEWIKSFNSVNYKNNYVNHN